MRSGTPMKRSRNDVALRTGAPFVPHASVFDAARFPYPRVTLSERVRRHRPGSIVRPERTDDGCRTAGIMASV